jgi:hypothetical protein
LYFEFRHNTAGNGGSDPIRTRLLFDPTAPASQADANGAGIDAGVGAGVGGGAGSGAGDNNIQLATVFELLMCGARFLQKFMLEDAIDLHAFAPLEASRRVTNGIPIGCPLFLPVHIVNCVQTLKARATERGCAWVPTRDPLIGRCH